MKVLQSLLNLSLAPFHWYHGARSHRKATEVDSLEVDGISIQVKRRFLRVARRKDEDHQLEMEHPERVLAGIVRSALQADIFTFDQKIPNTIPRHDFRYEMESQAVIRVQSYEHWWNHQIQNDARRMVRKAVKLGIETRCVLLSDELIRGIQEIWDESPVRQGRPFQHYRKDFETVKALNNTYPERTEFIGAYLGSEMVGFAKLFYCGNRADFVQIISKMKHRDKAPTNALLAKAVEVCAEKGISCLGYAKLVYGKKGPDSLTEWKLRNGCEQMLVPRYYVPLTFKGRLALALGLHKGILQALPAPALRGLLAVRARLYALRHKEQPVL